MESRNEDNLLLQAQKRLLQKRTEVTQTGQPLSVSMAPVVKLPFKPAKMVTLKCCFCGALEGVSRQAADNLIGDYVCERASCQWFKKSDFDKHKLAVTKGLGERFVRDNVLPYLRELPIAVAKHLSCRDSLYICGEVGTGKTLLLNALLVDALEKGCLAIMMLNWSDLKREVEATYNSKSVVTRADVYNKYRRCEVLFIDDIGVGADEQGEESRHAREIMYDLINDRYYKKLPFHIATNVPPAKLAEMYDERIARRINECCNIIVLKDKVSK